MTATFHQTTLALVYDFDGTLSPKAMQEYTVLPELGEDPIAFWDECTEEAQRLKADPMLTYMRLIIEKMTKSGGKITQQRLRELAAGIPYFPGVSVWFDNINHYVQKKSNGRVTVKHYIISAGLKDILDGITIRHHFENMFGSEYYFCTTDGLPKFPTIVVNDTTKTQYLFRINKGHEDVRAPLNDVMPYDERPIPFSNIIYIGDGSTDVPCMSVARRNKGYAIAVYKDATTKDACTALLSDERIDYMAKADYSPNTELDHSVKLIVDRIIADIFFKKEKFIQKTALSSTPPCP
jgi:hypothetical protein